MYNELILPIKEQIMMKMIPPLFCPTQQIASVTPQIWKYVIPPVSILLTENNGFPPKFEDQNNESKTPSY